MRNEFWRWSPTQECSSWCSSMGNVVTLMRKCYRWHHRFGKSHVLRQQLSALLAWDLFSIYLQALADIIEKKSRGSRDLNAGPGVGEGGPQTLKKIYYSNEKLVNRPSILLSVALQLFQCALHSLQTHFWHITNKFWIFSSFMMNNTWLAEDPGLQCFFKFKPVECQKWLFVTYIGILIYFRTSPTSCEPKMQYVFLGTAFFSLTYPF